MRVAIFLLLLQLGGCSKQSHSPEHARFTIEESRKTLSHRRYIWEVEERPYRVFDRGIWMHPTERQQSRWARILVAKGLDRNATETVLGEIYEEFRHDIEETGPDAAEKYITLFVYDDKRILSTDDFAGYVAVVQMSTEEKEVLPEWSPTLIRWRE